MVVLFLLAAGATWTWLAVRAEIRAQRVLAVILAVVMFYGAFVGAVRARADGQIKERCEFPGMQFLDCVSAGLHWTYVGTADADRIVGTEFPEIVRSGRGADYVDGGRGPGDVCYVGPADTVRRCEVVR